MCVRSEYYGIILLDPTAELDLFQLTRQSELFDPVETVGTPFCWTPSNLKGPKSYDRQAICWASILGFVIMVFGQIPRTWEFTK